MKIKVDSCISTEKEFYGTIYPESEKERDELRDLIILNETVKLTLSTGSDEGGRNETQKRI